MFERVWRALRRRSRAAPGTGASPAGPAAQLAEVRDEVRRLREAVSAFEHRQGRDIASAASVLAVRDTARFVLEHLPDVPRHPDPRATLLSALDLVGDRPGMVLEFGVGAGDTLRLIAGRCGGRRVVGFDAFRGLPETWRSDFPAGTFAQQQPPEVPGAELVVGLFEDTLPGFLAANPGPVAFLHLDADLYSSTRTVLEQAGPRLRPGSVVVFDEYFNYPGWQQHEHRAWQEFVARTGVDFRFEAYTVDNEQVVVSVTGTPWAD